MLKFDEALQVVTSSARKLGTERVELGRASNRVLAEDVICDIDMPPFNKSAMDGFACRRADLTNELTVVETIPAGVMPKKKIGKNQCAKIMTGAVVPEGADCVIMVEHTEVVAHNRVWWHGLPARENTAKMAVPLCNIAAKGEDVKKGDVVLRAGVLIKAQHIAVLASVGCTRPLVTIAPRVGIIATGDELVEPDRKPTACQIRNSNSFQLAAQVAGASAIPTHYGIAADTKERISAVLTKAMAENDVVIISGGVSVGDCDLVRDILKENGVKILFERVAVKPGRPTVFGIKRLTGEDAASAEKEFQSAFGRSAVRVYKRNTRFVFGLPGNPVSGFVMFELLVKPFLYRMMGHDFKPTSYRGQLERTIKRKNAERDFWLPVVTRYDGKVAQIDYHSSAHITALCEADGLLCVPAGVTEIKEGATVAVRQI
jgi:molybdopterin molybdotransferase